MQNRSAPPETHGKNGCVASYTSPPAYAGASPQGEALDAKPFAGRGIADRRGLVTFAEQTNALGKAEGNGHLQGLIAPSLVISRGFPSRGSCRRSRLMRCAVQLCCSNAASANSQPFHLIRPAFGGPPSPPGEGIWCEPGGGLSLPGGNRQLVGGVMTPPYG